MVDRDRSPRDYRSKNFEQLLGILARYPEKSQLALEVKQLMYNTGVPQVPHKTRQIQKRFNKVLTNARRHGWVARGKADLSNALTIRITRAGLDVLDAWEEPKTPLGSGCNEGQAKPGSPDGQAPVIRCPTCGDKYPADQFEDLSRREIREFKCTCGAKLGPLIVASIESGGMKPAPSL